MNLRQILRSLFFNAPWLILICVACVQLSLAFTTDLSPWKGGGFGMFAKDTDRQVRVFGLQQDDDGALVEREIQARVGALRIARNFPSEANLLWLLDNTRRGLIAGGKRAESLRAEQWRVLYDRKTRVLERHREKNVHAVSPKTSR